MSQLCSTDVTVTVVSNQRGFRVFSMWHASRTVRPIRGTSGVQYMGHVSCQNQLAEALWENIHACFWILALGHL